MTSEPTAASSVVSPLNPAAVTELTRFVHYLHDKGIQAQLLDAMMRNMPAHGDDTPQSVLAQTMGDIIETGVFGDLDDFELERVVGGAASLELLVRYARMIDESVLPRTAIPSDDTVKACLVRFHEMNEEMLRQNV